MRQIEIEPGLSVRFPARGADFDEGIEVGLALADLAAGLPAFVRVMTPGAAAQLKVVAPKLGYVVAFEASMRPGEPVEVHFAREAPKRRGAHLRLVSTA